MRPMTSVVRLVAAVALLAAGAGPLRAQLDAAPRPEPAAREPETAPPLEEAAPLNDGQADPETLIPVTQPEADTPLAEAQADELISITLDDVAMVDVIRMFTRISGANIIASAEDLEGTVTVNLQDVHWKSALNSILSMHGLTLVEKELGSGVYSVVPRPPDAPEPLVTKTFQLKFATVSDVGPIVRSMLPPGATVNEFGSRNMLVIRTTSENLGEVSTIITDVDQPTKQVSIETKFVELTDSASDALGIRWDSLAAFGVRLQGGPFTWTRGVTDTFTRSDSLSRAAYRGYANQNNLNLDSEGVRYANGNVAILQEDPSPTPSTGGSAGDPATATFSPTLSTEPTFPYRIETDIAGRSEQYGQNVLESFYRSIENNQAAILEMDQLSLIISALKTADGVELVSNPKMLVANGSTNAYFSVGSREPIIRTEIERGTTESPGDIITAELDTSINTEYIREGYLATGIMLKVVPFVKTDDLIEAHIQPSLRRKTGQKTVAENSWPIISVKEIQTRFTLRSGQTVAIGGLTDTSDTAQRTKVPLLGDIPLIGRYLFSHRSDVNNQVETIIFVTLALAQPETLYEEAGIPQNASLIHRKMIERQTEGLELEAELDELQETADEERREQAEEARTRLLKRRR